MLTVTSIVLLAATTTLLAAALAAGAIFYYAVLYTMVVKRHTRRSTEFGGVPGAAPVLIGWAAVTGSLDWPPLVFFGVVFCWQMPHFWALALRFRTTTRAPTSRCCRSWPPRCRSAGSRSPGPG